MAVTYKLLALDIDGTLIGPDEKVSAPVVEAVAAAEQAGLRVVLTTGRVYAQTIDIWRQLPCHQPYQPLVLVSGALVSEADTGRTLYQKTIPRQVAFQFADALAELHHSTLAMVDPWRHEHHYYMAVSADAEAVQRDWLGKLRTAAQRFGRLSEAAEMPNPLRLTAVVKDRPAADALAQRLKARFDGLLHISPLHVPAYRATIVEATAAKANKWTALLYVAQTLGVSPRDIVAVGDDANDVPMIEHAGLGVAMPGAPACVLAVADQVATAGLDAFIHELLANGP